MTSSFLHNSSGCSWQACKSRERNDVMRWHLLVQELSAALQPPSLAEGAAKKLTSFPCSRRKMGTTRIPPTVEIDMCLEEEEETRQRRILSAVWRCGKTRVGLKSFGPVEGTIRELQRQEFQNFPRDMPPRASVTFQAHLHWPCQRLVITPIGWLGLPAPPLHAANSVPRRRWVQTESRKVKVV